MNIHPTAVIHQDAKIHEAAEIGPYAVIGKDVCLEADVKIGPFCVIEGYTTMGQGTECFTGAVIGSIPQDKKFNRSEKTSLKIGSYNIFREYVTVNPGTGEGGETIIGDYNLFMAYAHVAHDCHIGNRCTLANSGTLAGHVVMEDGAIIGGLTAVHQFVRVGKLSIVGGCSKVVQDVPPFSTCDGHPSRVYGLNHVGLKRAQFSSDQVRILKKAFKILFFSNLTKKTALQHIVQQRESTEEIQHLIHFVQNSPRGLCGS